MRVTRLKDLLSWQAAAAIRISGAHHSSWNGRLGPIARSSELGGIAGWDHAIY